MYATAALIVPLLTSSKEQPITLFCHGIIDTKNQINRYVEFIEQPALSFNFSDAQAPNDWSLNNLIFQLCTLFSKRVNRQQMYMGTGKDIDTLAAQIDFSQQYIIFGFSRGGATAINYIAEHTPQNVQALILEATPADMLDSFDHIQQKIGLNISDNKKIQAQIFHTIFPAWQITSPPPVENIKKFTNKNLPILIIHSKDDSVVPISSAYKLYLAFLQAGFTNTYFIQLSTGQHAHYQKSPDRVIYLQALHSFYKKFGYTYNPTYTQNQDDLTYLQPTASYVKEQLTLFERHTKQNYLKLSQSNNATVAMMTAILMITGAGWYWYYK